MEQVPHHFTIIWNCSYHPHKHWAIFLQIAFPPWRSLALLTTFSWGIKVFFKRTNTFYFAKNLNWYRCFNMTCRVWKGEFVWVIFTNWILHAGGMTMNKWNGNSLLLLQSLQVFLSHQIQQIFGKCEKSNIPIKLSNHTIMMYHSWLPPPTAPPRYSPVTHRR